MFSPENEPLGTCLSTCCDHRVPCMFRNSALLVLSVCDRGTSGKQCVSPSDSFLSVEPVSKCAMDVVRVFSCVSTVFIATVCFVLSFAFAKHPCVL